jgi:hypothetical protein
VNNSGRTAFFTQAVLELEGSSEDDAPLPIIRADKLGNWARKLRIINDGWGELPLVTAFYDVSPLKIETVPEAQDLGDDVSPPFPYKAVEDPRADENRNATFLDLSEGLAASGADIKRLDDLAGRSSRWNRNGENEPEVMAALGPFSTNVALVRGQLQYANAPTPDTLQRVNFVAWAWLFNSRYKGAPRPPSYSYSVLLPPSGGRRYHSVPISQEVKNSDTDRFTLRIASERSSTHRFQLRLVYGAEQSVLSSWISLDLFMPRSAADFLAKNEKAGA